MFKRIFFSFSLVVLLCSFVFADDWEVIDRVLYKGTTDNPITLNWTAVDNKQLIMIKYNQVSSEGIIYDVYDGSELKISKVIDQTIESKVGKWIYIGYCSTQSNKIKVITQGPTCAIKMCKDSCDKNPIILTEGVFNSSNNSYTWEFPDFLNPNLLRIDYEFYLFDTQREVKVCLGTTSKCKMTIPLPRTGFYVAYIRSHLSPSEEEIVSWALLSRDDLVSLVFQRNFREAQEAYINNQQGITQIELYNVMIETGETSEWINSTMEAFSQVDCKPRAWWIYGHIAAPGPIVIE